MTYANTTARRKRIGNRGATLMMVLISTALLSVLGLAIALETTLDEQISHNYRLNVSALYTAEIAVDMVQYYFREPTSFTETGGIFGGASPYTGPPGEFFDRRVTGFASFSSYFWGSSPFLSQFADTDGDGSVDTSAASPALLFDRESYPEHSTFLDSICPDSSPTDYIQSLSIFAPPMDPSTGESAGVATVRVTAFSRTGVRTVEQVFVPIFEQPGTPPITAKALEALGAGWNGNPVLVHWGDTLILGDVNLGNNLGKIVAKDSTWSDGDGYAPVDNSSLRGSGGEDRWSNISLTGAVLSPSPSPPGGDGDDRPFDGETWPDQTDQGHGNIVQNHALPAGESFTVLDYYYFRALAQRFGGYYRPDAAGNLYRNGTGPAQSFVEVTNSRSLGILFIDTIDGQEPALDWSNIAELSVNGDYQTKGLLYLNAHLSIGGLGSPQQTQVLSPPWDESLADPASSNDPSFRITVPDLEVHFDGLLYVVGEIRETGNPTLFGSIIALGGFTGSGTPEIWYNWDFRLGDFGRYDIDPVLKGAWQEIYN